MIPFQFNTITQKSVSKWEINIYWTEYFWMDESIFSKKCLQKTKTCEFFIFQIPFLIFYKVHHLIIPFQLLVKLNRILLNEWIYLFQKWFYKNKNSQVFHFQNTFFNFLQSSPFNHTVSIITQKSVSKWEMNHSLFHYPAVIALRNRFHLYEYDDAFFVCPY